MAKRSYVIYGDESDSAGNYYGNFFGGVLLRAADQEEISRMLNEKKSELNLFSELKWQKVTAQYFDKYSEFINYYFTFVETGRLRTRIMFTQPIYPQEKAGRRAVDLASNVRVYSPKRLTRSRETEVFVR